MPNTSLAQSRLVARTVVALLLASVMAARASGPGIWRCTTGADGSVSYQSEPCVSGGRAVSTEPPPTEAAQRDSAEVAQREAKLAKSMARQRQRREATASPAGHVSLTGPVRQVSVGQQSEREPQTRSKQRRNLFRSEVPGRPRKTPQADTSAASPR